MMMMMMTIMFILWFLTFGFVGCQLFFIKFSVYILCIFCVFWLGASENSSIPANCAQKPRAPPPQHSTVSPHSDGHDHHNDHDDMVTITMMIMMPGPDDNLLDDIVPFVHFPHPDAFDKNHKVTQYWGPMLLTNIDDQCWWSKNNVTNILWRRSHRVHEVISCTSAYPPYSTTHRLRML